MDMLFIPKSIQENPETNKQVGCELKYLEVNIFLSPVFTIRTYSCN